MRFIDWIKAIDRVVAMAVSAVLVVVVAIMAVMAAVQVFLKMGNMGVLQFEQITRLLVIWIGFLGGAVATYQGRNISIDIVTRFVGPRVKRVLGVMVNGAALFLLGVLFRVSLKYVSDMVGEDNIAFALWGITAREWWFALIMPVGLGVMWWHFLAGLFYSIGGVRGPGYRGNDELLDSADDDEDGTNLTNETALPSIKAGGDA